MSRILIEKKGITSFFTDCVVNAANEELSYGGGVCGAIFKASGIGELSEACRKIGHCDTGDAVITPSFHLKNNKYIIHTVGPIYSRSRLQWCRDSLYRCYMRSLEVMLGNGCSSVTFPLVSAGIFGYPIEEAWRIAIKACTSFIAQNPKVNIHIYFAVIDDNVYEIGNKLLASKLLDIYRPNPILILFEIVALLHQKGYQKLRVMTYYAPAGFFRCEMSVKENFDTRTGFLRVDDEKHYPIYRYSTGGHFDLFHRQEDVRAYSMEELSDMFMTLYPELIQQSKGTDTEYVQWFQEVLKLARNNLFPYAYKDFGYDINDSNRLKLTNGEYIDFPPAGSHR